MTTLTGTNTWTRRIFPPMTLGELVESHVTRYTSHFKRCTSYCTRHTSHSCSALLYLSTWGEDFEGGEFVFLGEHEHQVTRELETYYVKCHASRITRHASHVTRHTSHVTRHALQVVHPLSGRLVTFTSGAENLHRVC